MRHGSRKSAENRVLTYEVTFKLAINYVGTLN